MKTDIREVPDYTIKAVEKMLKERYEQHKEHEKRDREAIESFGYGSPDHIEEVEHRSFVEGEAYALLEVLQMLRGDE